DAAALFTAVDAAARHLQTPGDGRTLDQLRADVLAGLGWSALAAGHLGCCHPDCGHLNQRLGTGRGGRAAAVNVTVAYPTLIGVDDHPAHLHGHGPITAAVARRIAAHGSWRRLLTDPASGAVLHVGRTRYTPPADLADHVIGRDQTCRFPTCTRPAAGCDLDHTTPGNAAAPPAPPTSGRCTAATTTTRPTTAGDSTNPHPADTSGPAPTRHRYQVDPEIVGLLPQPPPAPPAEDRPAEPTPADPDPPPF
ncbi:MAG TPA: DUF222 domain-containing protein, partial [Jiangellaceae bacterium]|nr:DUF222 domain-containing protein [Jiangellaceae bacterium]